LVKALITGINGFVGPYLTKELVGHKYSVFGCSLEKKPNISLEGIKDYFSCDMTDFLQVKFVLNSVKPDVIFHLAGFSSVGKSFENPELCFKINVDGTRNIINSIKELKVSPKLILISSAEVYGQQKKNPVGETALVNPLSPYAKSKVDQEKIALEYGNSIIIRAFNHTGLNQPDMFVIPSFRKQIREGVSGSTIFVGNIDVVRDFSNVVDVVRAYRIICEKGVIGEIYNVGSGRGYSLRYILNKMIKDSGKSFQIVVDTKKYRSVDIKELVCDNSKINKLGIQVKNYFD
jgi:GDP-4-dehydro-6-deoxy-D-mannose reductase